MIKKLIILASLSVSTANAWQVQKSQDQNWLLLLKAQPSVYEEMNKFFVKNDGAYNASAYIESFIPTLHRAMVSEANSSLLAKTSQATCSNTTEVSFPELLTTKYKFSGKDDFERNFLKVQSYTCLGKLNLDKVFETLMSEAFQQKAINGLKKISSNQNTNNVCVETQIFGLGTSRYCLTKNVLRTQNQYIIHSYNEENVSKPTAPIYFKETINVLTQLSNGEVSFYNLMYARGPDLAFRGMVKKKATKQQEAVTQLLIEMAK